MDAADPRAAKTQPTQCGQPYSIAHEVRAVVGAKFLTDLAWYLCMFWLPKCLIADGEHEHTLFGFRQLIEARAVDVILFDTNRVGGLTQARKIAALAEAHQIPLIPHAGQMHNYHVVMASPVR